MNRWIAFLAVFLMTGCADELAGPDPLGENSTIMGTWVRRDSDQEEVILERSAVLNDSRYGFTLREDGRFIERKNAGWCGTPPITYANFDGTWNALSDSLLEITVGYWGGMMNYQIRIIALEADELRIRYLYGDERLSTK